MDLPIVLSHKTAWLYHNVARPSEPLSRASSLCDEDSLANEAEPTASLPKLGLDAKGLRASKAVGIVTDYLVSLGIPREELDHIDTLVNFDFERSTPAGFRCHVFGAPIPSGHLIEVAEGLLVVDELMCFVQAGSWMSEPEQLEYGYEICARYHLNHLSTGDYIEMGQRYTVADLIAYCNENRSRQGAIRAAAVLKRVYDGARSPMETATAIMVVAKRSQGGWDTPRSSSTIGSMFPTSSSISQRPGISRSTYMRLRAVRGLNTTARTILINSAARRMRSV